MSTSLYLALMLGVIAICVLISVPSLFLKRCPRCGVRNSLDAKSCKRCQVPFAEDQQL